MAVEKAVAVVAPPPSSTSTFSRFQKVVLGWDFFRLNRESEKNRNASNGSDGDLKHVKSRFRDTDEYLGVFEPLLFEELKAQILQERDKKLCNWRKSIVVKSEKSDEFDSVTVAVNESWEEISENDLLLLSKKQFEVGNMRSAYAFGLVEHRGGNNKDQFTIRTYLDGEIKQLDKFIAESSPRLLEMRSLLMTIGSLFYIYKICSLSTIMREYAALHSIVSLPFKDVILSAAEKPYDSNSEDRSWSTPQPLMDYLKYNLNDSQLGAIHAGLSRKPFVLIQGPPGTGKTQTILGLLSAVLHSAPARVHSKGRLSVVKCRPDLQIQDKSNHWTKASSWLSGVNPRDLIMPTDGDDGFYPTGNELKPEIVSSSRKYRVHVLVCAPSNSALDEIVLRVLRTGLHDEKDHIYNPKIVRIGLKPHHSVQAVSLDYIVEQRLASADRSSSASSKHGSGGAHDRDRIRALVLDEAAIVFSTLSFSGSTLFSRMKTVFDVVIIDEAAQAVEPATLVPLAHGCKQVFLVGDPVQLPATVISQTAQNFGYTTSLFKRFQEAGFPVQMLNTQYRMHPEISIFPSKEFYNGGLEDGESVKKGTKRPWHDYRCFGPFCFFDIDGSETQPLGGGSWQNEDEAEFIAVMYYKLISQYKDLRSGSQVAVISPYRSQVDLLRERFNKTFGEHSDQEVDINTVDGFQGREKDVAIFSCVRANEGKGIGFVSDFRRMNVAITRAKSSILVVGSASTLLQDDHWNNLVKSAKERNCYFVVPKPYSSFFSDTNLALLRVVVQDHKEKKAHEALESFETMAVETEVAQDYDMDVDDGGVGDD